MNYCREISAVRCLCGKEGLIKKKTLCRIDRGRISNQSCSFLGGRSLELTSFDTSCLRPTWALCHSVFTKSTNFRKNPGQASILPPPRRYGLCIPACCTPYLHILEYVLLSFDVDRLLSIEGDVSVLIHRHASRPRPHEVYNPFLLQTAESPYGAVRLKHRNKSDARHGF